MNLLEKTLSIIKSIIFNFKVLKFNDAIKIPILISYKIKIKKAYKGCVNINCSIRKFGMIRIGLDGSEAIQGRNGIVYLNKEKNGKIVFNGSASLGEGIVLFNNSGTTIFGENFYCNKNCTISCDYNILFGKNVLIGWNVNVRDSDGHKVYPKNNKSPNIIIGEHVWICSDVNILKGCNIGNDCVISYNSCCIGLDAQEYSLIGGYPAKFIKRIEKWER